MSDLGSVFLQKLRSSAGTEPSGWGRLQSKPMTQLDHARMSLVLKHAEELYSEPIGKGIHRPYRVRLKTGEKVEYTNCAVAVMKTVHCQYETKKYCQSMDPRVTGPEREILAYELDRAMGFDLVPPTVGRHVYEIGYGSLQAWVEQPLAVDWRKKGYHYKEHPENPWLHRLAAYDFICGQIDRHAANWILDKYGRAYAIDNGYAFVKADDRRFLKCNVGKYLVGHKVHPLVQDEVCSINDTAVATVLRNRGFQCGEEEGVMKRLAEMRKLQTWQIMGGCWDPEKD